VKQDGAALVLASLELQRNRSIVLEALKQFGGALDFASFEFKKLREKPSNGQVRKL
jgi:hypothetical protein